MNYDLVYLIKPKYTSPIVLITRLLISTIVCYINYRRFHDKEVCHESISVQLKYYKTIYDVKQSITNFYI